MSADKRIIVYVCGRITGEDFHLAKQKFVKAELFLKEDFFSTAKNVVVLNPIHLPGGLDQEHYMDICLAMVRSCDVIYALEGFHLSNGALAETALASKLGKKIIGDSPSTKEYIQELFGGDNEDTF